jgi:hypothetical protein
MAKPGGSQFHVMIKPAGAACNLACTYCFYLGKTSLPGAPAPRRMSDEVLTELVSQENACHPLRWRQSRNSSTSNAQRNFVRTVSAYFPLDVGR